jgi:hypothetical protein
MRNEALAVQSASGDDRKLGQVVPDFQAAAFACTVCLLLCKFLHLDSP